MSVSLPLQPLDYVKATPFVFIIDSWGGQTDAPMHDRLFEESYGEATCTLKVIQRTWFSTNAEIRMVRVEIGWRKDNIFKFEWTLLSTCFIEEKLFM